MSAAFYIFRLIWPFLKELVLGGVSLKEGFRTQKAKVFLLFLLSGMFLGLAVLVPRFYQLSQEHIKLEKSVDVKNVHLMEDRISDLERKLADQEKKDRTPPITNVSDPIAKDPPAAEPASTPAIKTPGPSHRSGLTKTQRSGDPPDAEQATNRKKAYMDFLDQYDD